MKTTVEISDALLAAARKVAARNRTTVRALIEEGLRRVVEARSRGGGRFKLPDRSWGDGGLRPELRGATWEELRDATYTGRGT